MLKELFFAETGFASVKGSSRTSLFLDASSHLCTKGLYVRPPATRPSHTHRTSEMINFRPKFGLKYENNQGYKPISPDGQFKEQIESDRI